LNACEPIANPLHSHALLVTPIHMSGTADETTPLFSGEKKPAPRPSMAVLTRMRTASLKTVANAKDALRLQRGGKGHTFWFSVLSEHSHRVEARVYRYLIGTLILADVLAFILQTDAGTNKKFSTSFALLETLSAVIFFLEYCLRLYVAPEKKRYAGLSHAEARRKWLLSFGALIDLAAVAPSILQVGLDIMAKVYGGNRGIELPNLTWIRVLRLFRLLKSSAIMEAFDVFARVIYYNHEILLVSMLLGLVLILLLSTILYLLAPARDPSKQVDDYTSIPATMYLSVMMLTGQGQPDGYMPWYTKIVVCITSVFAVGLFAIFASMLTWGFEQEAEARIKRKHEEEKKRVEAILNGVDVDFVEELSSSSSDEDRAVGSDWEDYRANVVGSDSDDDEHELTAQEIDRAQNAFLRLDVDNSGFIATSDLAAIEGVKGETLLRQLDTDQDGRTTKEEFIDWLRVIKHSQSQRVFEKMLQSMESLKKQEISKPMATATTKLTYFEKVRVEKIFTYLDADKDGSISTAALSALPGMNGENLARQLDTNQSGTITRHEFVNWLCLIKQSRSQQVFDQVLDALDKAPADTERAITRRSPRWMSRQNTQKLQERSLVQFTARFDDLEAQNQALKEQLAEIKQLLGGKEGL